jgi:MoaA/NifB/PqqE/SkfB family radical SAM enzyme
MDWDLYCHIVDEIARMGGWYVGLNRFGESLLYPRFVDAVRYAKRAGIGRTVVVTNATRLEGNLAEEILDSGLDEILISLDRLDRKTYESSRRGARFDQVVENVDRFIELRRQRGSGRPSIVINSVLVDEDVQQIRALFDKYYDQVDWISLKPCARYGEGQDLPTTGITRRRWRTCTQPWERLNIFWNGETTVCCGDVEGELVVGNVHDSPLEWLWRQSPRALEIRRCHHRHEFDGLPVCRHCDATNLEWFEHSLEQLRRTYGAVGLGNRVAGLRDTTPIVKWPEKQAHPSQRPEVSAYDLEP